MQDGLLSSDVLALICYQLSLFFY